MSATPFPRSDAPQPTAPARSRRVARVVAGIAMAVLVSSCAHRTAAPTKFDSTVQKNFMSGCTGKDSKGKAITVGGTTAPAGYTSSSTTCKCEYTALVKAGFATYKKVTDDLTNGGTLPAQYRSIIQGCQ